MERNRCDRVNRPKALFGRKFWKSDNYGFSMFWSQNIGCESAAFAFDETGREAFEFGIGRGGGGGRGLRLPACRILYLTPLDGP